MTYLTRLNRAGDATAKLAQARGVDIGDVMQRDPERAAGWYRNMVLHCAQCQMGKTCAATTDLIDAASDAFATCPLNATFADWRGPV